MFDKMKGLFEMQKKMQEVKRILEETNFDMQSRDGLVKITMNGAQEVKDLKIKDGFTQEEKSRLEDSLKDIFNRSIKHAQTVAAQKMGEVTGFNLPGLT